MSDRDDTNIPNNTPILSGKSYALTKEYPPSNANVTKESSTNKTGQKREYVPSKKRIENKIKELEDKS